MLIKDTTVTFNWTLSPTDTSYAEDYFDLQLQAPDGSVTYTDGVVGAGGWQNDGTYVAPGTILADTVGHIETDILLDQSGVYTLILGTGGSTTFTIIDTVLALVVESDLAVDNTVVLP